MTTQSSTSAADAQKADRQRRFFAAISTQPESQQAEKSIQPLAQNGPSTDKPEPQESADPGSETSSTARVSSPRLSSGAAEQLKAWQNTMLAQIGITNQSSSDEIRQVTKLLYSDSGAQLPPEVAHTRSTVIHMQEALTELYELRDEEVPPELLEMKRGLLDVSLRERAQDALSPQLVEQRVNETLRAAGEPDIKLPDAYEWDSSQNPPALLRQRSLEDMKRMSQEVDRRMEDLAQRKPELEATIRATLTDYIKHCVEKSRA